MPGSLDWTSGLAGLLSCSVCSCRMAMKTAGRTVEGKLEEGGAATHARLCVLRNATAQNIVEHLQEGLCTQTFGCIYEVVHSCAEKRPEIC